MNSVVDREPSASGLRGLLGARRHAALGVAAALAITIVCSANLVTAIGGKISQGAATLKTVAALFEERSPGERVHGALASLKQKRQTAIREAALPKVRDARPLAELLGTPVSAPIDLTPVDSGSFDKLAADARLFVDPQRTIVSDGAPETPDGPLMMTEIGTSGAGVGGMPLSKANPEASPLTHEIPAVPEPSSWAMMLVGFGMTALTLRRRGMLFTEPQRPQS
jgi:PEP-CTERM motif